MPGANAEAPMISQPATLDKTDVYAFGPVATAPTAVPAGTYLTYDLYGNLSGTKGAVSLTPAAQDTATIPVAADLAPAPGDMIKLDVPDASLALDANFGLPVSAQTGGQGISGTFDFGEDFSVDGAPNPQATGTTSSASGTPAASGETPDSDGFPNGERPDDDSAFVSLAAAIVSGDDFQFVRNETDDADTAGIVEDIVSTINPALNAHNPVSAVQPNPPIAGVEADVSDLSAAHSYPELIL